MCPQLKDIIGNCCPKGWEFVAQAVLKVKKQYRQVNTINYMNDILLAHKQEGMLLAAYACLQRTLEMNRG